MVKLPEIYSQSRIGSAVGAPKAATLSPSEASSGALAAKEAVGKVGNLVDTVRQDYVQSEAMRRDAELDNQLWELEKSMENRTDPDNMEKEYQIKAAALRKQYLDWIPDRDAARRLEGRFNQKIQSGERGLFRKTEKIREDQTLASFDAGLNEKFKNIGRMDFPLDKVPEKIVEALNDLEALCKTGTLTAVQCEQRKQGIINDSAKIWNERRTIEDPEAHAAFLENYLKAKKSGAFKDYSTLVPESGNANVNIVGGGKLPVVKSTSGANFKVHSRYANRFAGLINDLEALGLKINPKSSGGFSDRYIDGTKTKSQHSFGAAIDINWDENARGTRGNIRDVIPEDKIRQIAKKWGMTWGGDWKNPDDMHFEIDRGATPTAAWEPDKIEKVREDAEQNLIPLPPEMEVAHKVLGNLSDVEVQNLLDKAKSQLQKNRTTDYYDKKAAAEGLVGRIKDGFEVPPEMEKEFNESISYLKSIGRGDVANRIKLERREAEFYRDAKSGKETINKDVKLSEMSPTELAAHEQGLVKLRRKADAIDSGLRENVNKEIATEIKRIKKLRNEDPAKSVENNTAVRAITEQVKEAEAVINETLEGDDAIENEADIARLQFLRRQKLEARLAEQERIDIANPRLVTEEQARELLPISTTSDDRTAIKKAVEEAFQRKLEELGDAKLASKVVQDAYELIITKDERRTAYRSSLSAALRGEDERMVNRQAAIDAQANRLFGAPPETGRPKQLPRPTKAERDLLRQNANNPAYVSHWASKYEPDAVTKVFNGWYDEVDQEMEDKAKQQAKAGEKAERTWSEYLFGE